MYHPFRVQDGKVFGQDDHGICYQPDNVFAKEQSGVFIAGLSVICNNVFIC